MYADEIAKADNAAALINEKAAQYNEMQASALAAAKRGYVDDIIEASETRQRVVAAFAVLVAVYIDECKYRDLESVAEVYKCCCFLTS